MCTYLIFSLWKDLLMLHLRRRGNDSGRRKDEKTRTTRSLINRPDQVGACECHKTSAMLQGLQIHLQVDLLMVDVADSSSTHRQIYSWNSKSASLLGDLGFDCEGNGN